MKICFFIDILKMLSGSFITYIQFVGYFATNFIIVYLADDFFLLPGKED